MKNDKIIYQTRPKLFNSYEILFLIGAFFVYTSDTLTLKLFMGGIFAIAIIFGIIKNYYANGIVITENRIELLKTNPKFDLKVLIPISSFEFGHVLKFLNGKGIVIILVHSDQELRMFIDGQIAEFPMRNEKTS